MDFAETVYWNAGVKTDDTTGMATVSFRLSDSVTAFRVLADAFAADGTTCEDGDYCTVGDTCLASTCQPGTPKTCISTGECRVAGTCDPGTGIC